MTPWLKFDMIEYDTSSFTSVMGGWETQFNKNPFPIADIDLISYSLSCCSQADFRGGQKLCYKNNFKRVISICAFLPHCLIFPLRSQTCKMLFETISDPTTLHFTAEGKLTGYDLEVIFALIIQLKRFFFVFFCLLTFSCSDWANWYCCGRRPDSYWGTHLWSYG